MSKKSKEDYDGVYVIRRRPIRMKPYNKVTWEKIEHLASMKPGGRMGFDELTKLAQDHEHGTKTAIYPYQFITYCIRQEWLQLVAT